MLLGADGVAVRGGCDEPALGGLSGRIRAGGKSAAGRGPAGQGGRDHYDRLGRLDGGAVLGLIASRKKGGYGRFTGTHSPVVGQGNAFRELRLRLCLLGAHLLPATVRDHERCVGFWAI
jgi:hypothetical protein